MALHGSDRSERKRQERRAREREERFATLTRQLDALQERIYALPDDPAVAMRLFAVAEELRLLHPDATTEREEALARIAAIVTEAEDKARGMPVARGRQARHAREDIPGIRGGRRGGR